ncbi:MAG: glycosyltransferase family 87 protein, partial [Bryobacteraceae bacterium]
MRRVPPSVLAIVGTMCVLWVALGSKILPVSRSHDFLNLYTGGSLALDGHFADLHDTEVQLERERRYVPGLPELVPFVRPAFYAVFLAPMALIPFRAAFVVWIACQILLFIACLIWAWWKFGPDALVFGSMSLPAALGIASGQDCVLLLALFIAAFEASDRKKPLASGLILGLMLFKFHLVLLWPLALLVQKRWRMLAGFSIAALGEAALSAALGGMRGVVVYSELLRNKRLDQLLPPQLMISYKGLLANLNIASPWAGAALQAAIALALIYAVRGAPLWKLFSITAAASMMVVPHVYGYDATLLLLPVLLTIFHAARPVSRIFAAIFATPLPFGFTLADKPWAIVVSASLAV